LPPETLIQRAMVVVLSAASGLITYAMLSIILNIRDVKSLRFLLRKRPH
jgi:hypothetical protein